MNLSLTYRRFALALIAVTQIFSSILIVPGGEGSGASVFRVLVLLLAASFFFTVGVSSVSRWPGRAIGVAAALSIWMMMSLAWTPDVLSGIKQTSYLITILFLLYVIENTVKDREDFVYLCKVVSVLGVVIAILSIYESETGNHFFRSSIQDAADFDMSKLYIQDGIAWFTFDNPNDLTVHLALCCFSLVIWENVSIVSKLLYILYFSIVLYVCNLLESRIILFSIILFIVMCLAIGKMRRPVAVGLLTKGVLIGSGLMMLLALVLSAQVEGLDVSGFIRLQLIWSSIVMFFQTYMLGIGTGGFEAEMWTGGFFGATYGFANPHNAMARILAENGIIGIALFGFLLVGPAIALSSARVVNRTTAFVAGMTIAMPLLLSSGSNPLSASSIQFAIALLWVGCRFLDSNTLLVPTDATNQPIRVTTPQ